MRNDSRGGDIHGTGKLSIARELILSMEDLSTWYMIASASAVLPLSGGVLLTRYGQIEYPTSDDAAPDGASVRGL